MGRHANLSAVAAYCLLMYSILGCIHVAYSITTNRGYYHYPPAPRAAVIPVIPLAVRWWNPSRIFIIASITTQISLL